MSTEPVLVFATFRCAPGKEDELLATLRTMVEHTRAEPGNEVYDLYTSDGESRSYHLFERYTDQDALQAHRDSEHYIAYRAKVPDLLSSPIEVAVLGEVDVAS